MPTFSHKSHTLHHTRDGTGQPLLFHHGLGSNSTQGPPLLASPATESDHQLICPDAPSHGRSATAPDLHSFDALADAAVALLDHLGIESAIFSGLSMGAGVSLNAALRHPARVRALILLRPAWLDAPSPDNLAVVARIGRWLETETPAATRELVLADPFYADMHKNNPSAAASLAALLEYPPDRARVLYDMVADAPFASLDDLHQLDLPALVISTEADPLHPTHMAERIADSLPNAQHHPTPPRYLEPATHAQSVAEHCREFLQSLAN